MTRMSQLKWSSSIRQHLSALMEWVVSRGELISSFKSSPRRNGKMPHRILVEFLALLT